MISYIETPVQEIHEPFLHLSGVRLLVKREDLNHPQVSGNKWWKLKYNLVEVVRLKLTTLLTFGGAYSNHIYAVAAAAKENGIRSIGIIRGEAPRTLNRTLTFANECGMHLEFVSREVYRQKTRINFLDGLQKKFGDFYLLPEGGTNELALKGCEEFAETILSGIKFDYLCLSVGTGGTLAGIVRGLKHNDREVVGFSSLKGGGFLEEEVNGMLSAPAKTWWCKWRIETRYHFGGYGRQTMELKSFIADQWQEHQLPLDPVYTSKLLFGVYDLIRRGSFAKGSTILVLHTGGMQGE